MDKEKLWTARWHAERAATLILESFGRDPDDPANDIDKAGPGPIPAPPIVTATPQTHTGELIARIAESQIGVKEVGRNGGLEVQKYQAATWLWPEYKGFAWCAALICWVLQEAKRQKPSIRWDPPRTAGARDLANWARDIHPETGKPMARSGSTKAGVRILGPVEKVRRGDLVIYEEFSHCGIATGDEPPSGPTQVTEGNTNTGGSRDGDGVYLKNRELRKGTERIRAAIRCQ